MALEIHNDRLKGVPFVKANASGGRMMPTAIVLHDTADRPTTNQDTVNWFKNKTCTVSAHFVVARDGSVTQMVDCDCKAFHAGKSVFKGRSGCNNFAIGIEIDNPGKLDKNGRGWFHKASEKGISGIVQASTKEHGSGWWLPYTPEQIKTVTDLCKALVKAYPSIHDITTHYEISPGRKIDTNPLFPLETVKAAVFAKVKAVPNVLSLGSEGEEVREAQARLRALGYQVGDADGIYGPQMRAAVLAFEAENGRKTDGELDRGDLLALHASDAKRMPVGAREGATPADLKKEGNAEVANADAIEKAAAGGTSTVIADKGVEVVTGFSPITACLDYLDTAVNTAAKVSGLGVTLPPRVGATILLAIAGYVIWRWAKTIKWSQVLKRRLGLDLSAKEQAA